MLNVLDLRSYEVYFVMNIGQWSGDAVQSHYGGSLEGFQS